jgi:3',5'-cyclic AMP phosphodiesterase CpdA
MSMITLLHVSDAHFGVHNPGDHKRITDDVLTAITEHLDQGRSSPHFCIFSGDLTQSAAPDQFAKAEEWLKTLSERASGVPIFLVPGNHDVRRPKGSKRAKDIKLQLRAAANSDESYNGWLSMVKTVPLLHPFFEWHEQAKIRVPIKSTWTLDSPFDCHYTTLLNGITVHLIGLNTAALSCDNDDKCRLVADETALNIELAAAPSSPADLVIVVTHHPVRVGEHLEQWLADWNDKRLAPLLLDRKGPHLYLHGHLHRGMGISTSLNTSEILTSFGAGRYLRA